MTSNIFSKTIKKTTLWSVILGILVAAAIVVFALFGFNSDITASNTNTMTVSVNAYHYETSKEEIQADCESFFGKSNVKYVIEGEMSGDECELVFVFNDKTNVNDFLADVEAHFAQAVQEEGALKGAFIKVSSSSEVAKAALAKGFLLRVGIASVVFAVLAFAYVAIRYQEVALGLTVGIGALASTLLSTAILVLTRICTTPTTAAFVAIGSLMTVAMIMISIGKMRAFGDSKASNEERIVSALAVKESLFIGVGVAVAMVLVGLVGGTLSAWGAVAALVAVAAALLISLFFAPAVYLSLKTVADSKPKKGEYVGAKKASQNEVAEPATETEETAENAD